MKIAICDDQKESLDILEAMLKNIKRVYSVRKYNEISQIMADMEENEQFDIIIMDIEWNLEQDGIDFASQISRSYPEVKIIYVTGYNEKYSQEIFLKYSNLAGYVRKPVEPNILAASIDRVWNIMQEEKQKKLAIIWKKRPLIILNRDILYIESKGHRAFIHTKNGEFMCYEKLTDLQNRLDSHFLCCHKSFLFNMEEISRIEKYDVIFFNGTKLPISKKRYDETRRLFFRYLGKELLKDGLVEDEGD